MTIQELERLSGINQGSNISVTSNAVVKKMKRYKIKPGTPEWFRLWFALPFMTGEKPVK